MKKILFILFMVFSFSFAQAPLGMVKIEYKEPANAVEKTDREVNRFDAAFEKADKAFDSISPSQSIDWTNFEITVKEASSEARQKTDKEFGLNVEAAIQQSLNRLNKRGLQYNKSFLELLNEKGLVSIEVLDSLPNGDLGAYHRTGNTFKVLIAKEVTEDPIALEWTLAHELGHGLGLSHETPPLPDGTFEWSAEIMSGNGVIDKRHLIYQIRNHSYYGRDIWKNYFNQI